MVDCYSQANIGSGRVGDLLNSYAEPALSSELQRRSDSSQDRRHCAPSLDLDSRLIYKRP